MSSSATRRCALVQRSISSPIRRASSSPSQMADRRAPSRRSPSSVHSVLPSRPALCGDQARGGGEDMRRSSGNSARAGSPWRRENPSRSAGCCRPRRRASHRSTGRRRRRSRCCCALLRRAAAARDTGRRWCPDTRRPGCSGSAADTRRSTSRMRAERSDRHRSSRSPKSQAFSVFSRVLILRRRARCPRPLA